MNKTYFYRKLLDVEQVIESGDDIEPRYIYNAIRACLSIELFFNEKIDNLLIAGTIENNIGKITAESLIKDNANPIQRNIALRYLKYCITG